jgi:hypothetical protein
MNINQILRKILKEATSDSSGSRGSYIAPLQPGIRIFKKNEMGPFTIPASKYDSPMLEFDSYDGKMDETKKQIKNIESKAKKVSNYIKNHPNSTFSDEDGNVINQTPGKNLKIVPIKEDLSVWFGDKKKSKGSSEPQGPWVNICSNKKGGGHPPCGRPDSDSKGYPKCRAAGVAAKMTDAQKKSACQQKRSAEKKDTQTGKGQKPIMTTYKPRTNENMKRKIITLTENDLMRIVKRVITEQTAPKGKVINLFCQNDIRDDSFRENDLIFRSEQDMYGGINGKGFKRLFLTPSPNSLIPRETYEDDMFVLDIMPANKLNKDFLNQSQLDDPNATIYFIGTKFSSPYFCRIDSGTDPEWETYLNTF